MSEIPEDVMKTARKYAGGDFAYPEVMKAIALAIMAERERCKRIVEKSAKLIPLEIPEPWHIGMQILVASTKNAIANGHTPEVKKP